MKKYIVIVIGAAVSMVSASTVKSNQVIGDECRDQVVLNTTAEVSMELFGIWQTIDNEFVQISRDMDFKITFIRVGSTKTLLAKGFISAGSENTLSIDRTYPANETYISQYVLSPSKKTLVIMKPNSSEAWVLHKVQ